MNSKVWFIAGASRGFGRIWAETALTRGDKVAVTTRNGADKACPVLNMMRNTLPFLLQQLVAPVLQLRGDGLDTGGLFDRPQFNAPGVVGASTTLRSGSPHNQTALHIDNNAKATITTPLRLA